MAKMMSNPTRATTASPPLMIARKTRAPRASPGGPGRTTGGDDFDSLMRDLQAKVFDRLPDETWVYPGHGNDTTLGTERGSIL
jgi:hypothetical protein